MRQREINCSLSLKVDAECRASAALEEKSAKPFAGPLERYQWRTSASIYMCLFTMLETPQFAHFRERCDNFANCLDYKNEFGHNDPRADDSEPFACATYR